MAELSYQKVPSMVFFFCILIKILVGLMWCGVVSILIKVVSNLNLKFGSLSPFNFHSPISRLLCQLPKEPSSTAPMPATVYSVLNHYTCIAGDHFEASWVCDHDHCGPLSVALCPCHLHCQYHDFQSSPVNRNWLTGRIEE